MTKFQLKLLDLKEPSWVAVVNTQPNLTISTPWTSLKNSPEDLQEYKVGEDLQPRIRVGDFVVVDNAGSLTIGVVICVKEQGKDVQGWVLSLVNTVKQLQRIAVVRIQHGIV